MTTPARCYKCHQPLLSILAAMKCARADCWLDFGPVANMLAVIALPSPEYKVKK